MKRCIAIVIASMFVLSLRGSGAEAKKEPLLLASFEPGEPPVVAPHGATVVKDKEHASHGEYTLKIEASAKDYNGVAIDDPATLKKFPGYILLKFDTFNPQAAPVMFGIRIDDVKSTSYGMRCNKEGVAAPGWSTTEINLSSLVRSNGKGNTSRDTLDINELKHLDLFLGPSPTPTVLYLDNIRLEPVTLPPLEGMYAFDFGPKRAPIYPGFTGCDENTVYSDERGYGWINPSPNLFENVYVPDALAGDYGGGEGFRLKLPNGNYEIQFCMDPFGIWGRYPTYSSRAVVINGKELLKQTMNGADFLDKVYYAYEEDEDFPGVDVWNKYIVPRNKIYTFPAEVADGFLNLQLKSPDKHGKHYLFLVVYPEAKKEDGRKWMAELDRQRHEKFNKWLTVDVPKPTGDDPAPGADDKGRGFIPFVRPTDADIAVSARPGKDEIGKPLAFECARGERDQAQFGLYPLEALNGVTVEVSDLSGPDGAKIPSSAFRVRKARNFLKHAGRMPLVTLLPYILMEFKSLDLKPGVARAVWLTLAVPADAKPGAYLGTVKAGADAKMATIPINVIVHAFQLDKVTDVTFTSTGATSCAWRPWFPGLDERWWQVGEIVIKDLEEHGMNAINGGPNAKLLSVKDGKAEIDYAEVDRWMELAAKHGLTMPADDYGGLSIEGMVWNSGPDCIAVTEKTSKEKFGISFPELVKTVYGEWNRHFKEKGWGRRLVHFLDEPRAEWKNIESCAELIKVCTAASPETLFTGYYSPGQGRDVYFQTMPVSIAHASALTLKLCRDAGKQLFEYSGAHVRYDFGRLCFVASRQGLKGFYRNGYIFACSDPYFDLSDEEASWCAVYPSKEHGVNDTVGWERTANGVNDYRYLSTLERLIKKARTENKAKAEADAAESYMTETLKPIELEKHDTANLTPVQFVEFKHTLAGHLDRLWNALEMK